MTAHRFLFVTWWGGGNLTPVRVLGRRLLDAGHEVRVLASERLRDDFAAHGIEVVGNQKGFSASPDELSAEIDRTPTDAVVVDFMQPNVFAAAEASGVRWAALVHTLGQGVLDDEHSTMLAFASLDAVNGTREAQGLAPVDDAVALLATPDRIFVAGPPAIDRPRRSSANGDRVRYLGALLEDAGPDAGWTPPGAGTGRPLVVVSLGTTPMDDGPVLQRVLDGAGRLPVDVFATAGEHLDPASFATAPNTTVRPPVRHAAVLPHAHLVVTHAGLGTVTAALAHGLPLVCLPLGRDQFDNATRVEELGAGVAVESSAPADDIAAAIERVLGDESFRRAAGALAGRIAGESAPDRSVAELVALADRA